MKHYEQIIKNFIIKSEYSFNIQSLKEKYSFLSNRNIFTKKIVIGIFLFKSDNIKNYFNKKNSLLSKKTKVGIKINFNNKKIKIQNSIFDNKVKIYIDKYFPQEKLIELLDDLIIIKFVQSKFLPIHSSGFFLNKKGYLLAAYGGTGKTRLILEANRYSKNCRIFDEWCLVKNKLALPLNKNILLMNYDIISYYSLFNKIVYYRAYLSKFFKFKLLQEFLRFLRIILPYKYEYFKNINYFKLNYVFFLEKRGKKEVFIKKISKKKISHKIYKNFIYEKKRIINLVRVNNSVSQFKKRIKFLEIYKNLLRKFINSCETKNILINNKNQNYDKIFRKILDNA